VTLLLAAKLVIAPGFVAGLSLLGRRFGPAVAGFLAAFPLVAGPVLALMVAEQGRAFGARAAFACAIGVAPTMLFGVVYAHAALRARWWRAVLLAYAGYFAAAGALLSVPKTLALALAVPLGAWALCLRLFPRAVSARVAQVPSRWDLPVRVAATMLLVLTITGLAEVAGPELSGLFAPFPIATAVLAVFAHRSVGGAAAAVLLRSLVRGLVSFVVFFVVLGLALVRLGPLAFGLATLAAMVIHALSFERT
jgi:hypothetical protein